MSLKPHPHAEVIKAFADGKPIQIYDINDGNWRTIPPGSACPPFSGTATYRIKPATQKYRVALMRYGNHNTQTYSVQNSANEKAWEDSRSFIRWLTPWIEYEV